MHVDHRLSRRRFLGASGAMAGVMAARGFRAWGDERADSTAQASFCFSLYGMRSLALPEALAACAKIGYDGVELDCTAGEAGDPERLNAAGRSELRRQLTDARLRLPALMDNLALLADAAAHRNNVDRLKRLGELGHSVAPDAPPIVETVLGGKPDQWAARKDAMARALEDWAKAGEESQTVIAIKAHVGGALHTPQDARWLVNRVDNRWLRLNYDYSHFQLYGFDLAESLELLLPRTVFIHVKDRRGDASKFRFLLPGDGDTDYVRYFQLLKSAGYRGAVCVEVSGQIHGRPDYDPVAAARRSYANLAPAFEKAGLRRV